MIDVQSENLIHLNEVTKLVPSSRPGKRLNIATIWRWCTCGVRGVVLESVNIGNSRFTSREAVTRFVERCSDATALHMPNPKKRTSAQRQRDFEKAERELDKLGVK
jgi:hypothetical protein